MNLKADIFCFSKSCEKKISELEGLLNEIESYKVKLIDYYCEDNLTFDLDEFNKNFNELCVNINKVKEVS
jgi:hypothetical protein